MKKINDPIIVQQVITMYTEEKLSMNKISQLMHISDSTVKRILVENGIEVKKRNLKYTVKSNLFAEIATEEDAYWLGFLYADGNVRKNGAQISLDLAEKDKDIVEKFRQYCQVSKPLYKHVIHRNDRDYISYSCTFSDETAKNNLVKLGCVPAKSLILECPTEEQVPQSLFHHFLRGYSDGDGYVRWQSIDEGGRRDFVLLGTENFLNDVVKRMNWQDKCVIRRDGKHQDYRLETYKIVDVFTLMSDIYKDATIYMNRKYNIYQKAKTEIKELVMLM